MESTNTKISSNNEAHPSRPKCKFLLPNKQQSIREALDHLFVTEKYRKMQLVIRWSLKASSGGVCHVEVTNCENLTIGKSKVKKKSLGACIACQELTKNKCKICNDHICRKDCKNPAWKKHKAACGQLPPSQPKTSTPNKNIERDEKLMISKNSSPFGKLTQQIGNASRGANSKPSGGKPEPLMSKSLTIVRQYDGQRRNNQRRLSEGDSRSKGGRSFSKNNQNKSLRIGSTSSAESESVSNSSRNKGGKTIKGRNTKIIGKLGRRNQVKKVVLFYKDPDSAVYWAMNECDMSEFESIHAALSEECEGYESIRPEVGLICGCKYGEEWYRSKIISLQPKYRVHYIDFGNSAEIEKNDFKKLPHEIKMVKNLVYRIEFDDSLREDLKKQDLTGKLLKVESKVVSASGVEIVKMIEDCSGGHKGADRVGTKNRTKKVSIGKKSSMNYLKFGSKGLVSFLPGISNMLYGMNVPDGAEKELEEDVKEAKDLGWSEARPYKAAEGDYVMVVDFVDQTRRGKVVSKLCSTYYVLLVDYGVVIAAETVYRFPVTKTDLIYLGANVIIDEALSEKANGLVECRYEVTGKRDSKGRWPCNLRDVLSREVIAKAYIQLPPEEGVTVPASMPMESGSVCELSIVTGVKKCYVRPLNEQAARKNLEMSVKMAEFLVKAAPLAQPPEIGKIYAAKNKKDDCFHRAMVKSLKNDNCEVLFVDYGTMEKVRVEDLKPLPISLKVVPFFASEVTLSGITVETLSESAKRYLDKLINENLTLVLTYTDEESEEVVLKEKVSGVVVNDMIVNPEKAKNGESGGLRNFAEIRDYMVKNGYLANDNRNERMTRSSPQNKSLDEGTEVIMKSQLKLPTISVNERYNLILQYVDEKEFFSTLTFWMANADESTFANVCNVVNSKIERYCREVSEPYRPKENEMCLARFEGDWYRGLTVNTKKDAYEIFFVDFGNSCLLRPKDIRKMKSEFMGPPAWAFKCIMSGVGRLIGKPALKKAVYEKLKKRMNSVLKNILVTKHEFEIHYVYIPEIEQMLGARE